jgi:hypothetical protein
LFNPVVLATLLRLVFDTAALLAHDSPRPQSPGGWEISFSTG